MSRLKKAGIGVTAAGALAIAVIGASEGLRTKAYKDVVGVPTICFGETRGVKMSDRKTVDECKAMLGEALLDFERGMVKCIKDPGRIPDKSYVAFLSLTYNIGTGGFCKSTVAKRVNAGDIRGACDAMLAWNKGGKPLKVIPGLSRRRGEERKLCLEGVAEGPPKVVAAPVPRPKPEVVLLPPPVVEKPAPPPEVVVKVVPVEGAWQRFWSFFW